jgi:glycosyltransferase involved in cell wall biosynthesis
MTESKKLFVGHDANRAGAQLVLLHWLRERKARGLKNYLLLVHGGSLLKEYKKVAKVWVGINEPPLWYKIKQRIPRFRKVGKLDQVPASGQLNGVLSHFASESFDCIIGNTVSSVSMLRELVALDVPFELYVHELSYSISTFTSDDDRRFMASSIRRVYAVSSLVKTTLVSDLGINVAKIDLLPPIVELPKSKKNAQDVVREKLGIPVSSPIVFSCGLAEWRKGPDVFLEVAKKLIAKMPTVHFIWLGLLDNEYSKELVSSKEAWDVNNQVHMLPVSSDSRPYFEAMNVFFLSSREDPFPLVMLEAAHVGRPIVGVRASGGVNDFLSGLDDLLVESWDVDGFVERIEALLALDSEQQAVYQQELKKRAVNYSAALFMDRWSELHSN